MARYEYIRRDRSSLAGGYLFRKRRRGVRPTLLLIWVLLVAGGLFILVEMDNIRPELYAMMGAPATATPTGIQYATEGDAAYWRGDLNTAVEAFRKGASLEPRNVDILYELTRMLIYRSYGDVRNLKDIEEALTWGAKAAEVAPNNARAHAIHCFALVRNGQSSDAVRSCLRALDLNPQGADAHAYLAMAAYDLARTSTALEEAERAVELDPSNIDANIAFARALSFQGRFNTALRHYQLAAAINPSLEFPYFEMAFFSYTLANRNNDESRYRVAITAYNNVLERNPGSVKAYTRLCQTYLAKGEPKLARQYCLDATDLDPGYTPAWRWLGEVYHKSRNYEDAVDAFKECQRQEIALNLPKEARDPTCWWLQGVGYFILGSCDQAIPILEDVLTWTDDPIAVRETNTTLLKCATAYEGNYRTPTPVPTATPRPTPIL